MENGHAGRLSSRRRGPGSRGGIAPTRALGPRRAPESSSSWRLPVVGGTRDARGGGRGCVQSRVSSGAVGRGGGGGFATTNAPCSSARVTDEVSRREPRARFPERTAPRGWHGDTPRASVFEDEERASPRGVMRMRPTLVRSFPSSWSHSSFSSRTAHTRVFRVVRVGHDRVPWDSPNRGN